MQDKNDNNPRVRFKDKNPDNKVFFNTLRARVDAYFKQNNISRYGNERMVWKTIILMCAYVVPFVLLLVLPPVTWMGFCLWSLMGLSLAGIGMSVMHDANHGAYSPNATQNYWLGHTLNLLGASVFNWKLQHNILHHTYTNVVHKDDDIDDKLIMRFSPHTEVKWYHQFQYIYAFVFYGILTLYWALLKDFVQFSQYTHEGVNAASRKENRIIFTKILLIKVFYFAVFLVLPITLLHLPAGYIIGGFLWMHFIAGIVLTVIFQLAHTVEQTSHPLPNEEGFIENTWAIHQLNTTVNFSRQNKWLSWYVGGLNFQVEHHLFPMICHVHYPAISVIVKETAEEFGIPYLENKTFGMALKSHIGALKLFGKIEPVMA